MNIPEEGEVRRLPAGAHGIPADVISRNQCERLIAAVAEACAKHGYAEMSVADLAHRAGLSTATFYKLFPASGSARWRRIETTRSSQH